MSLSLPVLMYHYISCWKNPIAVSPERFEEHCRAMRRGGWRGVGLEEAEAFFLRGTPLPPKSVLITFDDGFLDNHVHALPILEQYGHKGTVFAVAGKLEAAGAVRPTMADVRNGRCTPDTLPRVDAPYVAHRLGFEERQDMFLNWNEARAMEQSGIMRVASHSMWHRTVFVSPEYDGFHKPEKRTRTFDRVDAEVVWGLPRFKARPRLANRAFIPSAALTEAVRALVPQDKDAAFAFFKDPANEERLAALVRGFAPEQLGGYEDDRTMEHAIRRELADSKELLERELGRPENTLCWPWGAFSPLALRIAKEVGYTVFFTTAMGANPAGQAEHIHRFKAKDKSGAWLSLRLHLYSRPWLAGLYASMRI